MRLYILKTKIICSTNHKIINNIQEINVHQTAAKLRRLDQSQNQGYLVGLSVLLLIQKPGTTRRDSHQKSNKLHHMHFHSSQYKDIVHLKTIKYEAQDNQ